MRHHDLEARLVAAERKPDDVCLDFDDDCDGSFCALNCWLYQPERGVCPLLGGVMIAEGKW